MANARYFLDNELPCPFCGSEELRGWYPYGAECYMVECQNCITEFKFPDHVQDTAMDLWNERADRLLLNKVIDKAITLLTQLKVKNPKGE